MLDYQHKRWGAIVTRWTNDHALVWNAFQGKQVSRLQGEWRSPIASGGKCRIVAFRLLPLVEHDERRGHDGQRLSPTRRLYNYNARTAGTVDSPAIVLTDG